MIDPDRRNASLDLTVEDLRDLLAGVTVLAEQEVAAARSGPVFERPPSAVEVDRMVGAERGLPADGESVEELLAACAAVLAAGRRTTPTFFGYVQSPPAPVAVAADLLVSAADQNLTSWRSGPAAAAVEHQTLRWLGEFVGFDAAATGILVSGGSAANLTALLVALRAMTGPDDDRRAMRVYASAETHFSVAKAATALGVALEPVAVDRDRRLDPAALRAAIAADRAAGLSPIASSPTPARRPPVPSTRWTRWPPSRPTRASGSTWTARTGRPLRRTPAAASSSPACTAPTPCASTPTSGSTPRSTAARCCCTTRRPLRGRSAPVPTTTSASSPPTGRDLRLLGPRAGAQPPFPGAQAVGDAAVSRCATARGRDRRGHPPRRPSRRARRGRGGLRAPHRPRTEHLLLSACAAARRRAALDAHNERILQALQRDGRVYLSNATIDGRFALRACITNFRTTRADVEQVLTVVRELAGDVGRVVA